MTKSGFIKGMLTGVVVGAAATFMLDPNLKKKKNSMQHSSSSIFKNIGSMVDEVISSASK